MKQEFLKGFGLDDETCAAILGQHEKDVQAATAAGETAGAERVRVYQQKRAAMDNAFKAAGVARDSFRTALLATWDIDGVELDEGGEVKDKETLLATIKTDYPDFISIASTEGMSPATPPTSQEKTNNGDMAARIAKAYHAERYGPNKGPLGGR